MTTPDDREAWRDDMLVDLPDDAPPYVDDLAAPAARLYTDAEIAALVAAARATGRAEALQDAADELECPAHYRKNDAELAALGWAKTHTESCHACSKAAWLRSRAALDVSPQPEPLRKPPEHDHDDSVDCTLRCPVAQWMLITAPQPEDHTDEAADLVYMDPDHPPYETPSESVRYVPEAALRVAQDRIDAAEKALNDRVTTSLGLADWAADATDGYARVNPEWLMALITEAREVRAALGTDKKEES